MEQARKATRYRVAAVDTAIDVLNALAERPGATPGQLAADLKANRSLVFRMLRTLADRNYVMKDSVQGYRLGPQMLYLGQHAASSDALVSVSTVVLDKLVAETQQTAVLVVRDGLAVKSMLERRSSRPLQLLPGKAARGGLHTGGGGKVLLAYAPQEVQEEVIKKYLREVVPAELRTRRALLAALTKIRQDGFYEAVDEIALGIASISAPIHDSTGTVIAVAVVVGSTADIVPRNNHKVRQLTIDAANAISQKVNWADEPSL